MTVRTAPSGLLLLQDGSLLMKTEYGDNEGNLDVFIVATGERYWGAGSGGLDALCWEVTAVCEDAARAEHELPDGAEGEVADG